MGPAILPVALTIIYMYEDQKQPRDRGNKKSKTTEMKPPKTSKMGTQVLTLLISSFLGSL